MMLNRRKLKGKIRGNSEGKERERERSRRKRRKRVEDNTPNLLSLEAIFCFE